MVGFRIKVRKVGTSLGILIPEKNVKKENINVDDIITVNIKKGNSLTDLIGVLNSTEAEELKKNIKDIRKRLRNEIEETSLKI